MTEKMRVLHALSVHGERDLCQIAGITGIPAGRVFAALQTHMRQRSTVRVQRDGRTQYAVTDAGLSQVASWGSEERELDGV
ncbi:hypothetical protein ACFVXC_05645 [Streptomyces sp. NPDC058257]|uniref:hypothetical protein n=1 Tax=Streptomyces sp. NPDC058257 TaxID=3346409 RepID=UPI0036E9D904